VRKASGLATPAMWVPNLRLSRAAALAVPLGQPYHQAIRDKLVRLLERAGKRRARAAVQAYLEREEHEFVGLQFPEGWADQILSNDAVSMLVMSGDPEAVEPADAELAKEALEESKDQDLATFLSLAPGGTDHWDDDPGPTYQTKTGLEGLTKEDIDRILADEPDPKTGAPEESGGGISPTEKALGLDLSAEIAEIRRILDEHEKNKKK